MLKVLVLALSSFLGYFQDPTIYYLYVNTASTTGTQDCTTNTPGNSGTAACATLSQAESKIPADITAAGSNGIWTILCEGSAADTTAVTFSGTTTDATHYIEVKTDPNATYGRHAGVWSTSKYRMEISNAIGIYIFGDAYVRITGLQIKSTIANTSNIYGAIYAGGAASGVLHISNNILVGAVSGTSATIRGLAIERSGATTAYVWNNIIYDWVNGANEVIGIRIGSGGTGTTMYAYNNTVANCQIGISRGGGTLTAVNNIVTGSGDTNAYVGTLTSSNYNATDGTDDGDGGANSRVSQTFTFAAAGNYHLASNDAGAKGYGVTDPGSGLFADDIDGVTRAGAWDIGADQVTTAAATKRRTFQIQ